MSDDKVLKWQPVMLIADGRIECKCGALAIFVTMTESEEEAPEGKRDMDYKGWCQECFAKAQEETDD